MKPASPSVLIISGETSGERYAAQVVESFRELEPGSPVQFYGSGGEAMRRAGVELLADVEHLSAIGPWEAVKSLAHYLRLRREALAEVRRRGTRLALLVDFPDFNLLLARQLRRMGVTVLYYISPTVWAWRAGRVRTIRRTVRKMLCIFPFEEPIYRRAGVDVRYVGHPLTANLPRVDPPAEFRRRFGLAETDVPLSVLPGSRRAEIAHIFPTILAALPAIKAAVPGARFLLPAASAGARQAIEAQLDRYFAAPRPPLARADLVLLDGEATNCLANSRMGIVKSGTSTFEAALAGTPFVMVYRINPWMWRLGRWVLATRHFCIVNLIAGREVVPELMQGRLTAPRLADTFLNIFSNPDIYNQMKSALQAVRDQFDRRDAARNVAAELHQALRETTAAPIEDTP